MMLTGVHFNMCWLLGRTALLPMSLLTLQDGNNPKLTKCPRFTIGELVQPGEEKFVLVET